MRARTREKEKEEEKRIEAEVIEAVKTVENLFFRFGG